MRLKCPESECKSHELSPEAGVILRKGSYFRKSDGQWIPRYECKSCGRGFSSSLQSPCYRQKKRKLNHTIYLLLSSGVSQRRAARILGVTRRTVVRKFNFLAAQAKLKHESWLKELSQTPLSLVQFDDLETSEHSKCKPLSVTLAVDPVTRKVLGFQISRMPAKGHLSRIAIEKYGPRPDERPRGWNALFEGLTSVISPSALWVSDQNPHYPHHLKKHHPLSRHQCVKGRRGCVAGQGELKKIGFDPLFSLNHTCAMLRANLNRLFRRTWCTTKTIAGLENHLQLYIKLHNSVLTEPGAR